MTTSLFMGRLPRLTLTLLFTFVAALMTINIAAQEDDNRPYVTGTSPVAGAIDVPINVSISAFFYQPQIGVGVDSNSLTDATVKLYPTNNTAGQVPSRSINTSGGGDVVVMTPVVLLEKNTQYTFEITDGVKDDQGNDFYPYTMTFTTGEAGDPPDTDIEFTQVDLPNARGKFSSVETGPDGRLYASDVFGNVHIWDINPDGTLQAPTIHQIYSGFRPIIGLTFDPRSTADNPILWVTHNDALPYFGTPPRHFSGALSRLTATGLGTPSELWTSTEFAYGFPRSVKDHLTNSIDFGPDGALYLTQGSITAMGSRDNAWGQEPETILSAAILRIDVTALEGYAPAALPLNVATGVPSSDGNLRDNNNYSLGDPELATLGLYDPMAPGAPVTLYATGVRNAYDVVWHSNGELYAPANGSANGGSAASPGTPNPLPNSCNYRIDSDLYGAYTGPQVPHAGPLPYEEPLPKSDPLFIAPQEDYLFRIEQGGYYGHPNITRCEWVLNGGNPTSGDDYAQRGDHYPVGVQPDRNFRGYAYNFEMNKSPNGVIEYRSNTFGGQLRGALLVTRYSGGNDILVLRPGGPDGDIVEDLEDVPGLGEWPIIGGTLLSAPLDLAEDLRNGNLYVSLYGEEKDPNAGTLLLLKPVQPGIPELTAEAQELIFDAVVNTTSTTVSLPLHNTGAESVTVSDIVISGVDNTDFDITPDPQLPLVLQANETINLPLVFAPTETGTKIARVQIQSNDPNNSTINVSLRGLSTRGEGGGGLEPSLQWVMDAFNIRIDVGDDNPNTGRIHETDFAAPLLGEEIRAPIFRKAGPGVVTVQPLAIYGPEKPGEPGMVGWYPAGNPSGAQTLFEFNSGEYQTLNPTVNGVTQLDPGFNNPFGLWSYWPFFGQSRMVYTEGEFNTWATTTQHHVRVYAYKNASGTVVPNWYIVATEEHIEGWDFNDVVLLVKNVEPAAGGSIAVENPKWDTLRTLDVNNTEWMDNWFMFGRIMGLNKPTDRSYPMTIPVRLRNTHPTDALDVTNLTFSDANKFDFPNNEDQNLPLTINPGEAYELIVTFTKTQTDDVGGDNLREIYEEFLFIESTDPMNSNSTVNFRALLMDSTGGAYEPSTQQLYRDLFGFQIGFGSWTGFTHPHRANARPNNPVGEEVHSKFWERRDPSQPIYVRYAAAYHGYHPETIRVDFNSGQDYSFRHDSKMSQTVLPATDDNDINSAPFEAVIDRDGQFKFVMANRQACDGACETNNHGIRVFPARDPQGNLIPGVYLVGQDYVNGTNGANHDFQDNIFLVTNMRPVSRVIDVAADGFATPNPVNVGQNVVFNFTARNNSIYEADNVTFDIDMPPGVAVISVTPEQGNCTGLTCNLGIVAGEDEVGISVLATVETSGTITANGSVATSSTENTTNNNDVIVTVGVTQLTTATIKIVKDAQPDSDTPFDFTGELGNFQLIDNGISVENDFSASINFQDDNTVIDGFTPDSGAPYGPQPNGETYGWKAVATDTPIDANAAARDRGNVDTLLSTVIHMQRGDCCTSGFTEEIYWEHALPNGRYQVTVVVGDDNPDDTDGTFHAVNVEDVRATSFAPTLNTTNQHASGTVTVDVTDGALTVEADAVEGLNTKINYVIIQGVSFSTAETTFNDVAEGTYTITEAVPQGWLLDDVVCEGLATGINELSDGVTLTVEAGDFITCTFVNLNTTIPSIVTNEVLTVDEGAAGTIDTTLLDTQDSDTPDTGLVYTITAGPANGAVQVNAGDVTQFTQAQLDAGVVTYQHDDSETFDDSFDFELSDGDIATPLTGTFEIAVEPVNDVPVVSTNLDLTVAEGGTGDITIALLETTDEDNGPEDLTYTITTVPQYGTLIVNGVEDTEFTQSAINDGAISYQHNAGEESTDSFDFTVSDGFGGDVQATFTINVTPVNDAPTLVTNEEMIVERGTSAALTTALLETTDVDNPPAQLTYTVTTAPANGVLLVNDAEGASFTQAQINNGAVSYSHNNSDTTADSFDFEVSDGTAAPLTSTFVINVLPVNQPPTVENDSLTVAEGGNGNVAVLDNDTDTDGGLDATTVTVDTVPVNGTAVVETDGTVTYTHNGSETTSDSFTYTVADALGKVSAPATVAVTVTPMNDAPTITRNQSLSVQVGDSGVIDNTLLRTQDPDNGPAQRTFNITTAPQQGNVLVNGAAATSFTQAQVNNGAVSYQHTSADSTNDSFTFTLTDGTTPTAPATFIIEVLDLTDPKPIELEVSGDLGTFPLSMTFSWRHQVNVDDTQVPGDYYQVVAVKGNASVLDTGGFAADICTGVECAVDFSDASPYVFEAPDAYDWYVIAWTNNGGNWTNIASDAGNFTSTFATIGGINNLTVVPNQGVPTISWDNDPAAAWYQIYLGNSSEQLFFDWVEKAEIDCDGTRCSFTPDVVAAPGTYEVWMRGWGVGGFTRGGAEGWYGPATVTIADTAPPVINGGFQVTFAENGVPTLHWDGVANATWYHVWLGHQNTTGKWITDYQGWTSAADLGCTNMGTCSLMPNIRLIAGDYAWTVQAWGPAGYNGGSASVWAPLQTFTYSGNSTTSVNPDVDDLISPPAEQ
jgi:hypothetical protein